MEDIIEQRSG